MTAPIPSLSLVLALMSAFAPTAPAGSLPPAPHSAPKTRPSKLPADTMDVSARLDAYLRRIEALGFSGSALVARGDEILLEAGYGMADREAARPWTASTPSTIGSITKPFTATAITTLLASGRLSADDSLPVFFEDVPPDKASITVRHLLTHTAGFPGAIGPDFEPVERGAWVRQALAAPLLFEPGDRYAYSNVGYSFLGAIVEIVTGEGYEVYLRRAVLDPAGMKSTGYALSDSQADRAAVGYRNGERWGTVLERPWAPDGPGWHLRANGGLHSSVGDLLRFHRALEEGAILPPAWRDSMETRRVPENPEGSSHYGWGWAIFETSRGTDLVAHNGGNGIFAADLRRYVDDDVLVAAMSNVAEWSAIDVTPVLSRIAFGLEVELPPEVAEVDSAGVERLAGVYAFEDGGSVRVEATGDGHLVVRPTDAEALSALTGGQDVPDRAAREGRALAAVRAADAGDYEPVAELFGGGVPIEEVRARERGLRRRLEDELGPRVDTRVWGTAMLDGRPTTLIELAHERGSRFLRLRWSGEAVGGIGVAARPPSFELFPESVTDWFTFEPRSGTELRARFQLEDGSAGAVRIEPSRGSPARATRSG